MLRVLKRPSNKMESKAWICLDSWWISFLTDWDRLDGRWDEHFSPSLNKLPIFWEKIFKGLNFLLLKDWCKSKSLWVCEIHGCDVFRILGTLGVAISQHVFVSLASNRSPEKKRRRVEDMNETAGFGAPELFGMPELWITIAETERIWVNFYTPKDTIVYRKE